MERKEPSPIDSRRLLVGLGVLLLGAAAAVAWWQGRPEAASMLVRTCILLGAVWLAYPSLRSTRWGMALAVAGGAVLFLTRWRLVAGLILAFAALALFWARIRGRGGARER